MHCGEEVKKGTSAKGRRKIIRDPILGFNFYVQVGGTSKQAEQWLEDLYDIRFPPEESKHFYPGVFGSHYSIPYAGLIWLDKKCGGSTMAHEVAHAVTNVCRVLEMNPINSDEFHASYTGWLFKEVNVFIQGKK